MYCEAHTKPFGERSKIHMVQLAASLVLGYGAARMWEKLLLPTYVILGHRSLVSSNSLSEVESFNSHNFHLRTYHRVPSAKLRLLFVPSPALLNLR